MRASERDERDEHCVCVCLCVAGRTLLVGEIRDAWKWKKRMSREKEEMKNVRDEKVKRGNADAVPKKCEDGRLDADNDKDEETERCDGDVPRRRDQLGEAHTRMEDVSRPVRASHASTSGIRGNITKVCASRA